MKSIRNRNVKIQLWLNKAEARNLQEKAKRSHLSVAAYLRHLISGVVPKEAPLPDFFAMMRELHYIGNNLNQLAMEAHALNAIDAKRYDEGVQLFRDAVLTVIVTVQLFPGPVGSGSNSGLSCTAFDLRSMEVEQRHINHPLSQMQQHGSAP